MSGAREAITKLRPLFPHTVAPVLIAMLCCGFLFACAAQWDARCGTVATTARGDAATRGGLDGRCAPPSPVRPCDSINPLALAGNGRPDSTGLLFPTLRISCPLRHPKLVPLHLAVSSLSWRSASHRHVWGGPPDFILYATPVSESRCPNSQSERGHGGGGPSVLFFCATPVARSQDPERGWVPGVLVFGCVGGWVRNP